MSERIEFSSSRSGVEWLFVEQGGKKMRGREERRGGGGGLPLKISSRSCFVKPAQRCARGGNRKRVCRGNRVGSVWVWMVRSERERESREGGIREELKVSE